MFTKIQITGTITTTTGMHIGGNAAFAAIGAVDLPIIKDSRSDLPILPGSSLKGKLRTLLAKEYNIKLAAKPDDDCEELLRIFGSAKKDHVRRSRVVVSDMIMKNWDEMKKQGLQSKTEIKFENTICRTTAVAIPRQIERTLRGSEFPLDIIYEADLSESEEEMIEDLNILAEGFKLLQYDYIGGSGSRGYGKVSISDVTVETVVGNLSDEVIERCSDAFAEFR